MLNFMRNVATKVIQCIARLFTLDIAFNCKPGQPPNDAPQPRMELLIKRKFLNKVFDDRFIYELLDDVKENTSIKTRGTAIDALRMINPMWNKICRDWYVDLCFLKKSGVDIHDLKLECSRRLFREYAKYLQQEAKKAMEEDRT